MGCESQSRGTQGQSAPGKGPKSEPGLRWGRGGPLEKMDQINTSQIPGASIPKSDTEKKRKPEGNPLGLN